MLIIEPTKGRLLTDWSQINWTAVERNVKRLQGRIFRAVRAGNLAKAKSLQKLLARSSSAPAIAYRLCWLYVKRASKVVVETHRALMASSAIPLRLGSRCLSRDYPLTDTIPSP